MGVWGVVASGVGIGKCEGGGYVSAWVGGCVEGGCVGGGYITMIYTKCTSLYATTLCHCILLYIIVHCISNLITRDVLSVSVYIYIYVYVCVFIHIFDPYNV